MKANDSNSDHIELAAQLRCPSGERGISVANNMDVTNACMIECAINALNIANDEKVLEIGPGNAGHVQKLLAKATGIQYQGIDISQTMVMEAGRLNTGLVNVTFSLTDGKAIPFEEAYFDKIFTTNTIYFWTDPLAHANEINRVLKPGGLLVLGYIPKRVMQHIPFSKYGFTLYDERKVSSLLQQAGFSIMDEKSANEVIPGPGGEDISREFVITTASKL